MSQKDFPNGEIPLSSGEHRQFSPAMKRCCRWLLIGLAIAIAFALYLAAS